MSTGKERAAEIKTTSALARRLGLSRWTVSRVLNNHPGVRGATRERVLRAMDESGFSPSPMARGLRGSRTRLVGICFQELESPVLARKTSMLQHLLRERRYRALLELTGGRADLEEEVIRHFLSLRVDGVALVGSTLAAQSSAVRLLAARRLPVVAVDPVYPLPFPQVYLDREGAMRQCLKHLHDLGHRSFGLLGISADVPYGQARLQGLRKEARRLKLSFRRDVHKLAVPGNSQQDYGYGWQLAERLLALPRPPPALLALNDALALGAVKRLRERGCRVPEDFSIIGFDNLKVTAYAHPPLTTVDQQTERMMSAAAGLLLRSVECPRSRRSRPQIIQPAFIQRATTAPPPC